MTTSQNFSLTKRQSLHLRELLTRVRSTSFFSRLHGGIDPQTIALESMTDLQAIPFCSKADILKDEAEDPPYGTRLCVSREQIRQTHLTSGTSGFGQEAFALSASDLDASGDTWLPMFAAMGLTPGNLVATFYPVTFLAYGLSIVEGARRAGLQLTSLAGIDRGLAATIMQRLGVSAIGTRPAMLQALAQDLEPLGLTPRAAFPNLKGIVASGVLPPLIPSIEDLWGVPVHEVYGSSQAMGIIAHTQSDGAAPNGEAGWMTVLGDQFIVETLHPETMSAVDEGEAELILTCLHRTASPIIRFRTMDKAEIRRLSDGTVLIRVGSISRVDDMCKIRGNNVWPSQIDNALLVHPDVDDYICVLVKDARDIDHMRIRVQVSEERRSAQLGFDLTSRVKAATNVTPEIEFVDRIVHESIKPKRLIDNRQDEPR